MLDRRWTVLYVGTDLNATREAEGAAPNTDALMVASLSADQSELTLISLPRDTVDVPLADGGTWPEKINSLYVQRGIDELVGAMETLYGVPIDAYVVLDMDDFVALVDAVGDHRRVAAGAAGGPDREPGSRRPGPRSSMPTQTLALRPHPGRRGLRAHGPPAGGLGLAWSRKLDDPEADIDVREVLDSFESLETDLPLDDLPTLLELGRRAGDAEVDEPGHPAAAHHVRGRPWATAAATSSRLTSKQFAPRCRSSSATDPARRSGLGSVLAGLAGLAGRLAALGGRALFALGGLALELLALDQDRLRLLLDSRRDDGGHEGLAIGHDGHEVTVEVEVT